ncbi:MAG: ABC transporter permease [Ruminococcus sp.]|uniref:ABC transporter permease n=1 Tax=Ruminococcus sp. TaxID=41978 RepID=UPI001B07CA8A|nr:ABC transporter permease [Ruminococcus sp.]MBO7474192.1 ABC transporter permease [Ruminococcus sp.]
MKKKYRLGQMIIAAVNAVAVLGTVILTVTGGNMAQSQRYNYAAERWRNGSDKEFSQVSCFFSEDAEFETNDAEGVRQMLTDKLRDVAITPEEGKKLIPHAYSAVAGRSMVTCEIYGKSEAEITAVGGDFFLFRDFDLLGGAFFSDESSMKDGAVIDRDLAFALYGSENIAGKKIYIGNNELFVSGVIDTPETKAEKKCREKTPQMYISYYAAGLIFGSGGGYSMDFTDERDEFSRVTCYECVSPEPVENFTYSKVKDYLAELYKGKISIVNNKERFRPENRTKALKKLSELVIRKDSVVYPYWENASRLVELRLSFIYGGRRLLLAVMLITLVCFIVRGYIRFKRKKQDLRRAAEDIFSEIQTKLRRRLHKKAEQTGKEKAQ